MKVEIVYTDTFEKLLNQLIAHLSPYTSELLVTKRALVFIERFEKLVINNLCAAPISPSLLEIGIKQFHEFNADEFKLLYRVNELETQIRITVDTITSQKQDIEKVLVEFCLLYK